ncbi:hypothetical protein BH20ACI2_BH20ACI2_13830 [soil metagenome]
MRITTDTNLIVSAALWGGNPRRVLDAARDGIFDICTSPALLNELEFVLRRQKFDKRFLGLGFTVDEFLDEFSTFATVIDAIPIEPIIVRDPDDDMVLACAISSESTFIVSGDSDILDLKQHEGIRILTATELLAELNLR